MNWGAVFPLMEYHRAENLIFDTSGAGSVVPPALFLCRINTAATRAPRVYPSTPLRVHFNLCAAGPHLRQRGKFIIVFRQVRIANRAIVFRHGKGGLSQQLLEGERIPATVNQILSRECVAEQVDRGFLNAAPRVIPCDRLP